MMKRILLPTDFSSCARNAMKYAVAYFGHEDVQYILLNTYKEPPSGAGMLVSISDMLREESKRGVAEDQLFLEELLPSGSPAIIGLSEYGDLSYIIKEETKNREIDFVVMGTTGSEGLDKFFNGSHASNVIRSTKAPLWIIPNGATYHPIETVGFASDFEKLKNPEILDPLREIVRLSENELIVVNVQPEGKSLEIKDEDSPLRRGETFQGIEHFVYNTQNEDIVGGINQFINDYKVDILVLVARKYGFFESFFRRSITKNIAMLTDIPLLVLNE